MNSRQVSPSAQAEPHNKAQEYINHITTEISSLMHEGQMFELMEYQSDDNIESLI